MEAPTETFASSSAPSDVQEEQRVTTVILEQKQGQAWKVQAGEQVLQGDSLGQDLPVFG